MIQEETKRGINAGSAREEKGTFICVFEAGSDGQEGFTEEEAVHLVIKVWVRLHKHCWKGKTSGQRTLSEEGYRNGRC